MGQFFTDISVGRTAQDGSMPDAGRQGPTLPNSPPQFPLSDANIDVLFGGEDSQMGYQNDPYGLLDCPMVSETPRCTLYAIFQRRQGSSPSNELNTAGASATVDPVLDSTPLADDHETKFLEEARLQFTSERSSFVRLSKKKGPKTVTLAIGDGQLSQIVVLATFNYSRLGLKIYILKPRP